MNRYAIAFKRFVFEDFLTKLIFKMALARILIYLSKSLLFKFKFKTKHKQMNILTFQLRFTIVIARYTETAVIWQKKTHHSKTSSVWMVEKVFSLWHFRSVSGLICCILDTLCHFVFRTFSNTFHTKFHSIPSSFD